MIGWNEILELIFKLIIIPIIPLLAIYVKTLIQKKINEIDTKVKNDEIKKYLQLAEDALIKATNMTTETYVKALKEKGEFDLVSQQVAFEKSKQAFLHTISDATLEVLKVAYGDYETWIKITIESLVKDSK